MDKDDDKKLKSFKEQTMPSRNQPTSPNVAVSRTQDRSPNRARPSRPNTPSPGRLPRRQRTDAYNRAVSAGRDGPVSRLASGQAREAPYIAPRVAAAASSPVRAAAGAAVRALASRGNPTQPTPAARPVRPTPRPATAQRGVANPRFGQGWSATGSGMAGHLNPGRAPVGRLAMSQEPNNNLDQLDEAAFLSNILKLIRGYDKEDIKKEVAKMTKQQLKSVVDMAQPKSARRTLSPKDYMLWNAANERLSVNEEVEQIDELSKGTLKSYAKKADKDAGRKMNDADRDYSRGEEGSGDKKMNKALSRLRGVQKAKQKMREDVELEEAAKYKVGDKVIALKGAHKGDKHEVIHVFDDGSVNVKPLISNPRNIRYRLGAAKAQPEDLKPVNENAQLDEKAVSKSQQQLMGQALAYKRGEHDGEPSDTIKKLAKSMSEKDLEDYAKTKHKGLPDKVDEGKGPDAIAQLARMAGTPKNPTKKGFDALAHVAKSEKAREALKKAMKKEEVELEEANLSDVKSKVAGKSNFSLPQVQKAVKLADKYQNNMTAAVQAIEKIANGLSKHPTVRRELRSMNEDKE